MKRTFDVILAGAGLILSSPLWPLLAVAIKLADPGPVFFRQERWGRNGRKIFVLKFRTMFSGVDPLRPADEQDARVTRPGRIMRAMGLDELPQLVSILRGDMSFVGPRALAIGERVQTRTGIRTFEELPRFRDRLAVRPGLTGYTTVFYPKDIPAEEKLEHDLEYVRLRSFGLDLKLFALSLWISVRGQWEHRGRKY